MGIIFLHQNLVFRRFNLTCNWPLPWLPNAFPKTDKVSVDIRDRYIVYLIRFCRVTSSEKIDKENRYADFSLCCIPYPGEVMCKRMHFLSYNYGK